MLDLKQRQRFLRDNRARIGIGIVIVMSLAAVLAPLIARQSPITIDLQHILQRPTAQHWLGTDIQGRDIWSRLVYGARLTLGVMWIGAEAEYLNSTDNETFATQGMTTKDVTDRARVGARISMNLAP